MFNELSILWTLLLVFFLLFCCLLGSNASISLKLVSTFLEPPSNCILIAYCFYCSSYYYIFLILVYFCSYSYSNYYWSALVFFSFSSILWSLSNIPSSLRFSRLSKYSINYYNPILSFSSITRHFLINPYILLSYSSWKSLTFLFNSFTFSSPS